MGLQRAISEFVSTLLYEASRWPPLLGVPGGRVSALLIREFRSVGAISRSTAQRFRPQTRAEENALAALLESGVFRQPVPGRYYVDESELSRFMFGAFLQD